MPGRAAAHRPRGAAPAAAAGARLRRPGRGEGRRSRTTSRSGRTSALAEEIRLGYVAVTRARHLLLCSGSWWRDGKTAVRPVVAAAHRAGRLRGRRRRGRALGRRRRPTTRPTRRWRSGRSGSWPADPLSSGRRRALTAAAELVDRRGAAPARPERVARRADDPLVEQWVRDADLLLRERRAARQPDRRRPAALAPVGVGAGHAAPRPGRAGPPAAPADARGAGTAGPPRHRVPRLAGGAVRRREAGRPRRAARLAATSSPRPDERAGRAAGGLPRQRVGRPAAGRGRGAVRDAAGPADPARPDRRGLRRRRGPATRSSTGRPARRRRAPSSPPRRCSWPPTGWAGRG